jgi:ABC-type nitrate/sulfonate/bicarbonate transport system ATPase subunit
VATARALALNPKDLLKDEPLASLDTEIRRMLYSQLLQINQETNKTILLVTLTKEIIEESKELCVSPAVAVESRNDTN